MERFRIRMPTTCPGTSSRGRRDGREPRGRLAAAVAFVLGSSSAALPAARGVRPRALAPSLTTADPVVTYILYES
jgi:hypothetical protein